MPRKSSRTIRAWTQTALPVINRLRDRIGSVAPKDRWRADATFRLLPRNAEVAGAPDRITVSLRRAVRRDGTVRRRRFRHPAVRSRLGLKIAPEAGPPARGPAIAVAAEAKDNPRVPESNTSPPSAAKVTDLSRDNHRRAGLLIL